MIWQLHHQFKDGHTEMMAQKEFDDSNKTEHPIWVKEIVSKYPLPENAQWLACNQESKFFVGTVAVGG
jgi:hypothetical protein